MPTIALILLVVVAGVLFALYWIERQRRLTFEEQVKQLRRDNAAADDLRQRELSHAAAQQQAMLDSLVEGILVLDRENRVQLANNSLRRLFQLDHNVIGQSLMSTLRLPDLGAILERLKAEKTVVGFETRGIGVEDRLLQINATTIQNASGATSGSVLVFHDITRLKELENVRQEFVANVSHELRTPLSLIKGYVETLIDGAKDNPEVAPRFLGIIEKHTDRLTYLIEDLLTISRLESGQIPLNIQDGSLGEIASRVVDDLQASAQKKSMTLRNEISADMGAKIDSNRIQQVFFNLVDNAIKYGKPETEVTISAALEGKMIRISIRDHGPGIPELSQARIFERFYRVDKARSREQGGTGLGLAIVKHIVQSHGGVVGVTSALGEGSTFYFTVPR